MPKVLITGITGFLGSHIAEHLITNNIEVIGLKRKNSDIWRCQDFKDKIQWVDIDDEESFVNKLLNISFDTVVHAAWIGVESNSRNNWSEQVENISFVVSILEIAKTVGAKKNIFLGSQAEYGIINQKINEKSKTKALNAYAATKLASMEVIKSFCTINNMNWIWLRLFSLFGEKENSNWLIPSLIHSMQKDNQMDFTAGEQKYSYLYVKDYAEIMHRVITYNVESGIYNVSSNETRSIRSLIEDIKCIINPEFVLNFGVLDYRDNQSMHMEGDMRKLTSQIGKINFTDYKIALQMTLNYYKK